MVNTVRDRAVYVRGDICRSIFVREKEHYVCNGVNGELKRISCCVTFKKGIYI